MYKFSEFVDFLQMFSGFPLTSSHENKCLGALFHFQLGFRIGDNSFQAFLSKHLRWLLCTLPSRPHPSTIGLLCSWGLPAFFSTHSLCTFCSPHLPARPCCLPGGVLHPSRPINSELCDSLCRFCIVLILMQQASHWALVL